MQINNTYRPASNWGVDLGLRTAPTAPTAPVGGNQPVARPATQAQPAQDWGNWSGKGQVFDHAYDAYQFSKFPLSFGGVGFWTGGSIRRKIAGMFSKIPEDRLITLQVRHQLMRVEGMKPDHARVLQLAYFNHASTDPAVGRTHPLQWLSQYGASGSMNDWLLRAPLIVELGMHAAQVAIEQGFVPETPGKDALKRYGQAAAQLMPPPQVAPPQY